MKFAAVIALGIVVLLGLIHVSKECSFSVTSFGPKRVVIGEVSSGEDDALSTATCPDDEVLIDCSCSNPNKCDGSRADNQTCVAQNQDVNPNGIQAVAACVADDPSNYVYVQSGPEVKKPVAECPCGFEVISCTVINRWSTHTCYPAEISEDSKSCRTVEPCSKVKGCQTFAICRKTTNCISRRYKFRCDLSVEDMYKTIE